MAEEFKVLTDREHVLLRPGVYVGSVVSEETQGIINYKHQTKQIVPALIKIVEEVMQNSIDEHIRTDGKFAQNISVDIVTTIEGTEVTVIDDGRGIPQDLINGVPRPVLAWSELKAGSNFDDSVRVTAGTNGMGVALSNIFSASFRGETSDGKNRLVLVCSENMTNRKHTISAGGKRGTKVSFTPDLNRFGLNEFTQDHIDIIKDRIFNFAISYPSINFKFNGEKVHFKNAKVVAKQFHEDAISVETTNATIVFAPAGDDEEFRCLSYVNGIYVKNGGTHVDYILNRVVSNLREHVKKKHKIDVLPNQIKQHLLLAMWCRQFKALKFDSQSKERITNTQSEVSDYLSDFDFDSVSKQILKTPSIIDPMIAAILFKRDQQEALALAKRVKSTKKIRVVNHIAATSKFVEERSLIIMEGLSAIGQLIDCRASSEKIGGYPLKGKVMNVRGMKPVDIMKNKEISELLAILGLEIGKPAIDMNYGHIWVMTDSDVDGHHIRGLLLNLFSLWPELFEQKRIHTVQTPLYVCTKGKDVKWFFTKGEFDKANLKGYNVEYMKGLGSLPMPAYAECINNPRLITFTNSDQFASLEMAFGDSANDRKTWMMQ